MCLVCYCFFFSSRRRHTRFDCDWSSDVCSSDLVSGYDDDPRWADSVLWRHAIGVQRSDGSDQRLLLHHYSVNPGPGYWAIPWGTPSPDGKVVIFNSNMNGAGRYDLFVAEMPLR